MINRQRIDERVIEYVLNNGKTPRFILLDKNTFDRFTEILKAKERVAIAVDDFSKVCRMCCTANCWVDILSVDTNLAMCEVVG